MICRSTFGGISVNYRSYVICIGQLLADTSVKYRPIIGEVSAKCLRGIGDLKAISADIHIDRLSTECRPSVDRQSTECRSSVDRVSTATSTDIAVDTTYSKHDPYSLAKMVPNHSYNVALIVPCMPISHKCANLPSTIELNEDCFNRSTERIDILSPSRHMLENSD